MINERQLTMCKQDYLSSCDSEGDLACIQPDPLAERRDMATSIAGQLQRSFLTVDLTESLRPYRSQSPRHGTNDQFVNDNRSGPSKTWSVVITTIDSRFQPWAALVGQSVIELRWSDDGRHFANHISDSPSPVPFPTPRQADESMSPWCSLFECLQLGCGTDRDSRMLKAGEMIFMDSSRNGQRKAASEHSCWRTEG